ncbi:cobaltochelatase subunit CobN [Pseudomonas aeruginosa]|nr:cobaltochelatase subunit CobN [Pseudomonas aeruginosa]
MQYACGGRDWGVKLDGGNLFAEQSKGVQAAISRAPRRSTACSPPTTRSSASAACRWRYATSTAPAGAVHRRPAPAPAAHHGRRAVPRQRAARALPQPAVDRRDAARGYAGSLEMLDLANNLWAARRRYRTAVRADQWRALCDTFVMDRRELGLAAWFETHNPDRLRRRSSRAWPGPSRGYWDASEQTRRERPSAGGNWRPPAPARSARRPP